MPDVFISNKGEEKASHLSTHNPEKKFFKLPGKVDSSVEKMQYHNHNPFSAFCIYPHKVGFMNQEEDEQVVLIVRRHFLTNVKWILSAIGIMFLPHILKLLDLFSFLPPNYQLVIDLIFYLLALTVVLQGFLSWFFSVNIITNRRVIDVNFDNLIYRRITDAETSHIEDASVIMGSVVRTLFDYSDVNIQTAAETEDIIFEAVPHPDKIAKILSDLRLGDNI